MSEMLSRPYRAKKKCEHFSSPEKKEHLVGARESPPRHPEAPEGYQRLTLGQPWVNVGSTLGQPSVSSLAISGRFWPILPVMSISTEDKRTCICKMVDFPIRKRDFRVCGWSGAFWEPLERKKEKTKCIYKVCILLHCSEFKFLKKNCEISKYLTVKYFANF